MRPTFSEDDLVFAAAFAAGTPAEAPTIIASHIPLAPESGFPEAKRRQLLAFLLAVSSPSSPGTGTGKKSGLPPRRVSSCSGRSGQSQEAFGLGRRTHSESLCPG